MSFFLCLVLLLFSLKEAVQGVDLASPREVHVGAGREGSVGGAVDTGDDGLVDGLGNEVGECVGEGREGGRREGAGVKRSGRRGRRETVLWLARVVDDVSCGSWLGVVHCNQGMHSMSSRNGRPIQEESTWRSRVPPRGGPHFGEKTSAWEIVAAAVKTDGCSGIGLCGQSFEGLCCHFCSCSLVGGNKSGTCGLVTVS